jgi:hypothetical protein
LVGSAVLLGVSVLTKISLGILGLVFCAGLVLGEIIPNREKFRFSMLMPSLVFGIMYSALLAGVAVLVIGLENIGQVLSMLGSGTDLGNLEYKSINEYLKPAWPWILLGGIGVLDSVREKKWISFYLLAWVTLVYILLLNHSPVWGHHQLYVTVPLAMLSAKPVSDVLEKFWRILVDGFSPGVAVILQVVAVLATLAIILPYEMPEPMRLLSPMPLVNWTPEVDPLDEMVMAHMALYRNQTNWVVTDNPMYAFRSRLLVPPELAVFSRKRLSTGEVTEGDMIQAIEKYRPEQVLIWRFALLEVNDYLGVHYYPVYSVGDKALWIRNDIEQIPLD